MTTAGEPSLRRAPRRPPGYTLIELVIVLTVMGALLALATPSIQSILQHSRVNAATTVLAVDLQYAQMLAARQRRPVVFIVVPGAQQYLIRDRPAGGTIFRTRAFGEDSDLMLEELTSTNSAMEIFPTGITHETTLFTVGLGGYHRQVRFTKAGQIRVLSGF